MSIKMKKLSLDYLKKKGACLSQLLIFKKLFGDEVIITEKLCETHAMTFEWTWAGYFLFEEVEKRRKYSTVEKKLYEDFVAGTITYANYKKANAKLWGALFVE